jgi:hypothetical protein
MKTELSREATLEALETGQFRCTELEDAQIFYNGEWLQFGRTDWKDDVGTGCCFDSIDALLGQVSRYIDALKGDWPERWPGARVSDGWFCVLDAYSDG